MLHGDEPTPRNIMHGSNVHEDHGDDDREHDRGEQQVILRLFVPDGRMLVERQAAGPDTHEIEPLQHDESNEVYTGSDREMVRDVVVVLSRWGRVVAVAEPEAGKRDVFRLEIPVGEREADEGLDGACVDVALEEQFPVHQMVFLDVPRWVEKNVGFGLFVRESHGGSAVGETADDDHEEG